MTRREALQQLVTFAPAWRYEQETNLTIHLNWKSVVVIRNGETVTIDPQELFDALKAGNQ